MKEPIHVLLIEDNPGDVRLIQERLADLSTVFELECVNRLSHGLDCLARKPADLVLLDLLLPDEYGITSFIRLNAKFPGIPIVILTGFDDQQLALEGIRLGAEDYLFKGTMDANQLERTIKYAIERHRVRKPA